MRNKNQAILCTFFIANCVLLGFSAQSQPVQFIDILENTGIDFEYTFGDKTYENILESSGGGVTVFDYNNDGYQDIYFLNGVYIEGISDPEGIINKHNTNKLYKNNGDLTFTDVSITSGLDNAQWSMAASPIDYDADGDLDLFLLNYGDNKFFSNNGDGTFTDITQKLNLAGPNKLNGFTTWSVSAAFWDYNGDDLIDIMVGNFLAFDPDHISPDFPNMMPHPAEYEGQATLLYLQNSDGSYSESTEETVFYYPNSKCMGLTIFDFDQDGDMDLFQGNDHQMNFMFRNDGQQQFKEVAQSAGVAVNADGQVTGSMHGTIGDINGDGLIDLLVTDLKYGAMYQNLGDGVYKDVTIPSGIAAAFNKKGQWAANLFDFDNDGDLDLYTANGTAEELILQPPLLMENTGNGHFENVGKSKGAYFNTLRSGRGGATVDLDNDGDLDIIISHVDLTASPAILLNEGGNNNNWLGIELIGKGGQSDAIGANLTLSYGNQKLVRINQWSNTYLSNNDPRVHFGLNDALKVDKLEIKWPSGSIEVFEDIAINQYLRIFEGKGIQ